MEAVLGIKNGNLNCEVTSRGHGVQYVQSNLGIGLELRYSADSDHRVRSTKENSQKDDHAV